MRRITAAGLSALALYGVIGTTTGTANADATGGQKYGAPAGTSGQAGQPPPIGKTHSFAYSIPGSEVWGLWYRAMNNGKEDIWLQITVRHSMDDGQQAAFCYKIAGVKGTFCVYTHNARVGGTRAIARFVGAKSHYSVKAALGHVDPKSKTFHVTKSGRWHKLF